MIFVNPLIKIEDYQIMSFSYTVQITVLFNRWKNFYFTLVDILMLLLNMGMFSFIVSLILLNKRNDDKHIPSPDLPPEASVLMMTGYVADVCCCSRDIE